MSTDFDARLADPPVTSAPWLDVTRRERGAPRSPGPATTRQSRNNQAPRAPIPMRPTLPPSAETAPQLQINADFDRRAVMRPSDACWQPSPLLWVRLEPLPLVIGAPVGRRSAQKVELLSFSGVVTGDCADPHPSLTAGPRAAAGTGTRMDAAFEPALTPGMGWHSHRFVTKTKRDRVQMRSVLICLG